MWSQNRSVFSLAQLFGFIAIVGVFLAAIVAPGGIWPHLWQLTVYGAIFSAGLAAIYRPSGRRGFWVGFVVFAVGFFAIEQFELTHTSSRMTSYLRRSFQRSEFLDGVLTRTVTNDLTLPSDSRGVTSVPNRQVVINEVARRISGLIYTTDLLVVLVLGVIGGAIGRSLGDRQEQR